MKISAMEILQRIYDSEIHMNIGWLWDGGVNYEIGVDGDYIKSKNKVRSGETDLSKAVVLIANDCLEAYPLSTFSVWWMEQKRMMEVPLSACVNCGEVFKEGDKVESFLRSPEEPQGSWGGIAELDKNFQDRYRKNADEVQRRHALGELGCAEAKILGQVVTKEECLIEQE